MRPAAFQQPDKWQETGLKCRPGDLTGVEEHPQIYLIHLTPYTLQTYLTDISYRHTLQTLIMSET